MFLKFSLEFQGQKQILKISYTTNPYLNKKCKILSNKAKN